jgi:hypothetical protein
VNGVSKLRSLSRTVVKGFAAGTKVCFDFDNGGFPAATRKLEFIGMIM